MFDSEYIPGINRIEQGPGVVVDYTINSEGEGVWKARIDSDYVVSIIGKNAVEQKNSTFTDSDWVLQAIASSLPTVTQTTSGADSDWVSNQVVNSVSNLEANLLAAYNNLQNQLNTIQSSQVDSDAVVSAAIKGLNFNPNIINTLLDRIEELEDVLGTTFETEEPVVTAKDSESLGNILYTQQYPRLTSPLSFTWAIRSLDGNVVIKEKLSVGVGSTVENVLGNLAVAVTRNSSAIKYFATFDKGTLNTIDYRFNDDFVGSAIEITVNETFDNSKFTIV